MIFGENKGGRGQGKEYYEKLSKGSKKVKIRILEMLFWSVKLAELIYKALHTKKHQNR